MAGKRINAARLIGVVGGKGLVIPPEGWNSHNFAQHGTRMIFTLQRVAKLTQRQAIPDFARKINLFFNVQLEDIVARVTRRRAAQIARTKSDAVINVGAHEALWTQAINEVFAEAGIDIVAEVLPSVQSVMSQGYSKTGILLGHQAEADATVNAAIARKARAVAQQVTAVNSTTREQISRLVRTSIQNDLTVSETAAALEQNLPAIFGNRSLTIARTELNKAWTQGAISSLQESETVTHISVIGCESREVDRWQSPSYQQFTFRGESTCNIQDVPIRDADSLNFHPNHTGNIVPSRFRNPDGTVSLEND